MAVVSGDVPEGDAPPAIVSPALAADDSCAPVTYYEVQQDGQPISRLLATDGQLNPLTDAGGDAIPFAHIYMDAAGDGTVGFHGSLPGDPLAGRRIQADATFYVNADSSVASAAAPLGSQDNPYQDIASALDDLKDRDLDAITLHVAEGEYTWGTRGKMNMNLNVIGAGAGRTIVRYSPEAAGRKRYVASLRVDSAYIQGVTFDGDENADGDNNPATNRSDSKNGLDVRGAKELTIVESEFRNAGTGDGLNTVKVNSIVVYDSHAHHNFADGFSYTSNSGVPVDVLEAFVEGSDNGINGQWNSQGSTVHADVRIVRVGSVFQRNATNISDVSSSTTWNVDVTTADAQVQSTGDVYYNYYVSGNGTGWIIGGQHNGGSNDPTIVHAQPGAQIRYVSEFETLSGATLSGQHSLDDSPLHEIVESECQTPYVTIEHLIDDEGSRESFETTDQTITLQGAFWGESLQVSFAGATYNTTSPELQTDNSRWTLDLTSQTLDVGEYQLAVSVDDADSVTQQVSIVEAPAYVTIERLIDDQGSHESFETTDQTITLQGGFSGESLQISIAGNTYDSFSPELQVETDRWTLDLTAQTLDLGAYLLTVSVDGADSASQTINIVEPAPEPTTRTVSLGAVNKGIAVDDKANGTGYLMFSEIPVAGRFTGILSGNSANLVAVRQAAEGWEYNNNSQWIAFEPAESDRLLATVDFTANTVSSLEGASGTANGIKLGFVDGDLLFEANRWNNKSNKGEFTVSGTQFTAETSGGGQTSETFQLGLVASGIGVRDAATGTGFIMYSVENVHDRFGGLPGGNSAQLVAVQHAAGQWYYNDNTQWLAFTPGSSDRLIAAVDYTADTINGLQGTYEAVEGIQRGYETSDLTFQAGIWRGRENRGEFTVSGTYFVV